MPTFESSTPQFETRPMELTSASLALFTAALWGGNAVAASFAMDCLPPIAAAAARFALAAVFMVFWCLFSRQSLGLKRAQIRPAFVLGFLMSLQIATFNIGVKVSNSSHGVLLVNMAVFWILGLEHYWLRSSQLTVRKVMGAILAMIGLLVILFTTSENAGDARKDAPSLLGDLVLLASSVVLALKMLYTRHAVRTVEAGKLILWHDLFGVACLCAYSATLEWSAEFSLDGTAVMALLYQGLIVGGLCFAVNAVLLKKHTASQISIFGFAAPLFGVILAWLWRADPLTPWLLVAAVCIAVGIVFVNLRASDG